jgi:hypothetical protein
MNIITAQRTYATQANAQKALEKTLTVAGLTLDNVRWLIAVNEQGRFVPTLVGIEHVRFAHAGIMVIG